MKTLLLDTKAWDIVLGMDGNVALADVPYAQAQDVASAIKTFLGECWYNTTLGIPYFDEILGHWPAEQTVKNYVEQAALTVPGIVRAQCTIISLIDRVMTGQCLVTNDAGVEFPVSF